MVRTYAWLSPYMNGMHNTIDGWRYDRDSGGWKLKRKYLQAMLAERFQISEWRRRDTIRGKGSDREKEGIPD